MLSPDLRHTPPIRGIALSVSSCGRHADGDRRRARREHADRECGRAGPRAEALDHQAPDNAGLPRRRFVSQSAG